MSVLYVGKITPWRSTKCFGTRSEAMRMHNGHGPWINDSHIVFDHYRLALYGAYEAEEEQPFQ